MLTSFLKYNNSHGKKGPDPRRQRQISGTNFLKIDVDVLKPAVDCHKFTFITGKLAYKFFYTFSINFPLSLYVIPDSLLLPGRKHKVLWLLLFDCPDWKIFLRKNVLTPVFFLYFRCYWSTSLLIIETLDKWEFC